MKRDNLNFVGLSTAITPGKWCRVVWFYQGLPAFEEVYYCPEGTPKPEKHFKEWVRELSRLTKSITIDIHIKELEITNDPLCPYPDKSSDRFTPFPRRAD